MYRTCWPARAGWVLAVQLEVPRVQAAAHEALHAAPPRHVRQEGGVGQQTRRFSPRRAELARVEGHRDHWASPRWHCHQGMAPE